MRKRWLLPLLGIVAFLLFALVTLPASVVLGRLGSLGINTAGVDGTLWRGSAQMLQAAGVNLGSVSWNLHFLPLFTGRLQADIKLKRVDGFAETTASFSLSSAHFERLTASLPLSILPAATLPGGWSGTANVRFPVLSVRDGWPTRAEGTLEVMNLTGPARRPANIGSYKVEFPAQNAGDSLNGALSDLGGPLRIEGTVQLKADRSYLIEGLVATRPETPPDVVQALQFLGAPDAQGRRPFSLAGTM